MLSPAIWMRLLKNVLPYMLTTRPITGCYINIYIYIYIYSRPKGFPAYLLVRFTLQIPRITSFHGPDHGILHKHGSPWAKQS